MGGLDVAGRGPSTARSSPTFSTAGPSAAVKKRRCVFSMPMARAASPTRSRYGNISRVSVTARSKSAALGRPAGRHERDDPRGAAAMPSAAHPEDERCPRPATAGASARRRAGPLRASVSLKTGMIAVDSAPSASSRRSRFGMRKATKKASVTGPGAECARHHHVATIAEDPAGERGEPDGADGPHDPARGRPGLRRSRRQTP